MKKSIILLVFCAAALLAWVSSGFSWHVYSSGCGDCHGDGFGGFMHYDHPSLACDSCHPSGTVDSPPTSNCIVCHPVVDPGLCTLVIGHAGAPVVPVSCMACHSALNNCPEQCETDADCDDGNVCTGLEICVQSAPGEQSTCVYSVPPLVCDDGDYCSGEETCDPVTGCEPGTPIDCGDGIYCNGEETCNEYSDQCDDGTPPDCGNGVCSEELDMCVECISDSDCGNGLECMDGVCETDTDLDATVDAEDNCPDTCNPQQLDGDQDGVGDVCDTTPGCGGGGCGEPDCEVTVVCDTDADQDGFTEYRDNCPDTCNSEQLDADEDGIGDVCDPTPLCGGGCGMPECEVTCTP